MKTRKNLNLFIIVIVIIVSFTNYSVKSSKGPPKIKGENILKIGETAKIKNLKITVNSKRIISKGKMDKLSKKNKFFIIDVTIENISKKSQTVSPMLMLSIIDANGRILKQNPFADINSPLNGVLESGKKVTGEYAVEVSVGITGLKLIFKEYFSSSKRVFISLD